MPVLLFYRNSFVGVFFAALGIMKQITILFILCAAGYNLLAQSSITDNAASAVGAGNAKELAKLFGNNIDLAVADKEGVYSSAQAELILKDFFAKHSPKAFTIIHQGTSKQGLQYIIGNLVSDQNYRVSFYIKKQGQVLSIQQLRIDAEE